MNNTLPLPVISKAATPGTAFYEKRNEIRALAAVMIIILAHSDSPDRRFIGAAMPVFESGSNYPWFNEWWP